MVMSPALVVIPLPFHPGNQVPHLYNLISSCHFIVVVLLVLVVVDVVVVATLSHPDIAIAAIQLRASHFPPCIGFI